MLTEQLKDWNLKIILTLLILEDSLLAHPPRMRDHVGEEIVHVEDGEEEAECDEEWTEHLPLSGKGEVMDKDAAADKAVTTEVAKSIDLFK